MCSFSLLLTFAQRKNGRETQNNGGEKICLWWWQTRMRKVIWCNFFSSRGRPSTHNSTTTTQSVLSLNTTWFVFAYKSAHRESSSGPFGSFSNVQLKESWANYIQIVGLALIYYLLTGAEINVFLSLTAILCSFIQFALVEKYEMVVEFQI